MPRHGKKSKIIYWPNIIHILFIVCFLFISIKNIPYYNMIHVCGDEFGYWANAAFWSGKDWTSLMQNTPYYSYGYSLFLFAIAQLNLDMSTIYKIAILLNIMMVIIIYFLTIQIIKSWFHNIKNAAVNFIAFVCTLYPSILTYTQLTFNETLIAFLNWLTLWSLIKFEKTNKNRWGAMVLLLSVFLYIVHQRNLGILCASIFILIIIIRENRGLKKNNYFAVFAGGLILFIVSLRIKEDLVNLLWGNSSYVEINDYSGQVSKINYIFTLDGIKKIILSLAGKIFYLYSATFFLGNIGYIWIVKRVMQISPDRCEYFA